MHILCLHPCSMLSPPLPFSCWLSGSRVGSADFVSCFSVCLHSSFSISMLVGPCVANIPRSLHPSVHLPSCYLFFFLLISRGLGSCLLVFVCWPGAGICLLAGFFSFFLSLSIQSFNPEWFSSHFSMLLAWGGDLPPRMVFFLCFSRPALNGSRVFSFSPLVFPLSHFLCVTTEYFIKEVHIYGGVRIYVVQGATVRTVGTYFSR